MQEQYYTLKPALPVKSFRSSSVSKLPKISKSYLKSTPKNQYKKALYATMYKNVLNEDSG